MATTIGTIETLARRHLNEATASFWSSDELVSHIIAGIKDLWRATVDLKEEHYLTIDTTNVTLSASSSTLTGVPSDVHKVYLIEPRDLTQNSTNRGLVFKPLDYNHELFQRARSRAAITPSNDIIYYAPTGAGSPVAAPTIQVAPQVNSAVNLSFIYIPTVSSSLTSVSNVPIPGEADNALVAWCVAYARAKEREDRMPDPGWITTFEAEKAKLLMSLGVRQLQEPKFVDALFEDYWN